MDADAFSRLVAELQVECYADDLDPPDGADRWSSEELRCFFESGGESKPEPPPPPPPPPVPAQPLCWDDAACAAPLRARTLEAAHSQGLTRVHIVNDPNSTTVAAPRLLSSSWDATAKLWRLPAKDAVEDALPVLDCLLQDPSSQRWAYDAAPFWYGGDAAGGHRLGVVTSHTGGMAGEPEQVLRLWELSPAASRGGANDVAWDARTSSFLNTQGCVGSAAHIRGVHAVDANATHLVSISDDLLVLWAVEATGERLPSPRCAAMRTWKASARDRPRHVTGSPPGAGVGTEIARRPSPLTGSATRIRFLRDGQTVVCAGPCGGPRGESENGESRGLPVLRVGAAALEPLCILRSRCLLIPALHATW